MIEKIPNTVGILDFPFEMWFWYQLRYQPKVLANVGFGFGIGSKPKWWFLFRCYCWYSQHFTHCAYGTDFSKLSLELTEPKALEKLLGWI